MKKRTIVLLCMATAILTAGISVMAGMIYMNHERLMNQQPEAFYYDVSDAASQVDAQKAVQPMVQYDAEGPSGMAVYPEAAVPPEENAQPEAILQPQAVAHPETPSQTGKLADSQSAYIGAEKAQAIALAKVPGAYVDECELDHESYGTVYEIKLKKDYWEYKFEIDAVNGNIIQWDKEIDD